MPRRERDPIAGDTPVSLFVDAMVAELALGDSPADRRSERLLRRLSVWATGEGLPLDRELILDPDTVERFVQIGLARDRSQATYRAVLRQVAPKLTKTAPWEPRPRAIARRALAPPYTGGEVATLRTDATLQPTAARKRAARALLALGLGAGLDGRWVTRVAAGDVIRRGPAVLIQVDEPQAREVVILAEWETEILDLAAKAGSEFLVGGSSTSRNRTSNITEGLVVPTGHPRLSPARLRSTWLLGHVAAGSRLPELCAAAGLKGVAVLADLFDAVPALPRHRADAVLRRADS